MAKIIQLKITLIDSKPPIWRRIQVKDNTTFHKLHEILQVVMGWGNYHLYDFQVNNQCFSVPHKYSEGKIISSKKIKLNILKEKQKFNYTYDFGDCWMHKILVEKIVPDKLGLPHPICIKGKLPYPPEDYGRIGRYRHLFHIQKNKNHPEYEELIKDWLGEKFDPDLFDMKRINKELMEQFIDGRTKFWVVKP